MIALVLAMTLAAQVDTAAIQSTSAAQAAKSAVTAPAAVETRPDGSQVWWIMSCPTRAQAGEIVVCGRPDDALPREPAPGRGANRDLSAANALALQSTPCAARQGGCQVGFNIFGPPTMLVRVIGKLINPRSDCCEGNDATDPLSLVRDAATGLKRAFAAKPDRSNRVPIVLDEPVISPQPVPVADKP